MESDMRKKEAEENAIAEIAESSGSGPGKGIRNMLSALSVVCKVINDSVAPNTFV